MRSIWFVRGLFAPPAAAEAEAAPVAEANAAAEARAEPADAVPTDEDVLVAREEDGPDELVDGVPT